MVSSSTALSILTLFSSSSAMAQVFTREDGKCGLVGGVEAGCEHIPPFPTCCQENGHCGWDCDGSENYGFTNVTLAIYSLQRMYSIQLIGELYRLRELTPAVRGT